MCHHPHCIHDEKNGTSAGWLKTAQGIIALKLKYKSRTEIVYNEMKSRVETLADRYRRRGRYRFRM